MPFEVLHPPLAAALAARGYTEPTPVQAAVLASEHTGRNLLVSARTGSGKTVAFGLCLANELLEAGALPRPIPKAPLAIIIAPTRELALQVRRELAWLWADARVASCVGGMDFRSEARALAEGAHLVVGTPGRLCDHLSRGSLRLDAVRAVVLDEADEMLDLGFRDELERLLDATPAERRTLMFSATLPDGILSLAKRYQKDPVRIAASSADEPHADIEHRAVMVAPREREHAIVNLLRFVDPPTALVFCATRDGVAHLHASMVERGFPAVALSGELSQAERGRALQSLRDGRARVLVATDVAARGLDLPDLQLVIHADLPNDAQVLLHRSGRTGRAGRKGTSVALVVGSRRRMADRLFYEARLEPKWSEPPSGEAVRAKDRERAAAELDVLLGEPGEEATEADALLARHTPQAIAAALIRLHRKAWPEPEELPETEAFYARLARPRREDPRMMDPRRDRPVFIHGPHEGGDRGPRSNLHARSGAGDLRPHVQPRAEAKAAPGQGPRATGPSQGEEGVEARHLPLPAALPQTPSREPGPPEPADPGSADLRPKVQLEEPRPTRSQAEPTPRSEGPTWKEERALRKQKEVPTQDVAAPKEEGESRPKRRVQAPDPEVTRLPRPVRPDPRVDGGNRPLRRRDAEPEALEAGGDWGPGGGRSGAGIWFRLNVGRMHNADPRWLIPLICRRGNIEKSDIGSIRVMDTETRFEVASNIAEQFFVAARRPDRQDPRIRIVLAR